MISLNSKKQKPRKDSTIALINIIFLMLIFFMLAGRISPSIEKEIELALSEKTPPSQFQDALIITATKQLYYHGKEVDLTEFWRAHQQRKQINPEQSSTTPIMKNKVHVIADKNLSARILLR